MNEFEIIRRYFERSERPRRRVELGIGDDCAVLAAGGRLAVATDMLVAGRHFFEDADPRSLGHKALAVNLSDLAAMGAAPVAFTLALALPSVDEDWLAAFSEGLFALADEHDCALVGGDTTRGPLNVSITVLGELPERGVLRRDAARAGHDVWVSGELGAAALAVIERRAGRQPPSGCAHRLDWPRPQIALGQALLGVACAAIDVSDGLIGDLGHIVDRSSTHAATPLGIDIDWPSVPVPDEVRRLPQQQQLSCALCGGDDYEIAFSAPAEARARLEALAREGLRITRIGRVTERRGVRVLDVQGRELNLQVGSFDHFA